MQDIFNCSAFLPASWSIKVLHNFHSFSDMYRFLILVFTCISKTDYLNLFFYGCDKTLWIRQFIEGSIYFGYSSKELVMSGENGSKHQTWQ